MSVEKPGPKPEHINSRVGEEPVRPHLTRYGDKTYDVRQLELAARHLPEQAFDLSRVDELKPILEGKYWKDSDGKDIGPSDLLEAYRELGDWEAVRLAHPGWEKHIAKVERVNYQIPVLVYEGNLIDGIHRLTKALVEGATSLPMKVLPGLPTEAEYIE